MRALVEIMVRGLDYRRLLSVPGASEAKVTETGRGYWACPGCGKLTPYKCAPAWITRDDCCSDACYAFIILGGAVYDSDKG